MIKTLHWYLVKELIRVTLLALVALTLVMTVFGIIEPLREVGLGGEQVLAMFGYLVPVMLSLTLPVAALFGATIVYGRFSQDNELLAARASGISTLSLLKPAMGLGVVVSALALLLGNFVAPGMMEQAERTAKDNIAAIVFPQLKNVGHIRDRTRVIHADGVDADRQILTGLVAVDGDKPDDLQVLAARSARVSFHRHEGDLYVTIEAENPLVGRTRTASLAMQQYAPVQFQVPSPLREKPAWYDWPKLVDTLRNPSRNRQIDQELSKIKRRIGHDMFVRELVAAVNSDKVYDRLRDGERRYEIRAVEAFVDAKETARLSGGARPGGPPQPVEIRVYNRDDLLEEVVTAGVARVRAEWSVLAEASLVTIQLSDNVASRTPGRGEPLTRPEWARGELAIPREVQARAGAISMHQVYDTPELLTENRSILDRIDVLKNTEIQRLLLRIKAEMHGRISYGASCLLLVALGAALGLIFRGGHFISAFAIALVPGTVLIVMMIMGKEIMKNQQARLLGLPSEVVGLACIWGGILILAVANLVVYLRLARR